MTRILLVEDETDVRNLMTTHLSREGFEIEVAETGEKASCFLEKNHYDLAILDWMLPDISGLEICKRLNGKLPVLMVTARSNPADIVLALEMGADDYVTKPFEIPVFLARVRALLRRTQTLKDPATERYRVGLLRMDTEEHRIWCGDEE